MGFDRNLLKYGLEESQVRGVQAMACKVELYLILGLMRVARCLGCLASFLVQLLFACCVVVPSTATARADPRSRSVLILFTTRLGGMGLGMVDLPVDRRGTGS